MSLVVTLLTSRQMDEISLAEISQSRRLRRKARRRATRHGQKRTGRRVVQFAFVRIRHYWPLSSQTSERILEFREHENKSYFFSEAQGVQHFHKFQTAEHHVFRLKFRLFEITWLGPDEQRLSWIICREK